MRKRCNRTGEIAALTKAPDAFARADDLALITMADELAADDCVTDATWAALAARRNDAEHIELPVVAGFDRRVSGFLNSAGVQLDATIEGRLALAGEKVVVRRN